MSADTWELLYARNPEPRLLDYAPERWVVETALAVHTSGLWLDAGAGDGRHADSIGSPTRPVVAVDAAMSSARHDVLAKIEQLPFRDGSFALTVCADVLSILEDPVPALRELARVCTTDGHVIVTLQTTEDETADWGELLRQERGSSTRRRLGPYDVTFYTSIGIDGLVAESGMDVVACEFYIRYDGPHPHMQVPHRHALCGLLLRPKKRDMEGVA